MILKKVIGIFFLCCMVAGYAATILPILSEQDIVVVDYDPYDNEESENETEKEKEGKEEKEEIDEKNKEFLGYQNSRHRLSINNQKGRFQHKSYTAVFIDIFTPPPELSI